MQKDFQAPVQKRYPIAARPRVEGIREREDKLGGSVRI